MADILISPGTSIQTTVNGASPYDRILLAAGQYTLDNTLTLNKAITIMPQVAGTHPEIRLSGTTHIYILTISANDVIIDGVDINNLRGTGAGNGYFQANGCSGVAIRNSKLHDFRRFFLGNSSVVTGFELSDSEVYRGQYTFFELDNARNVRLLRNWFHDQIATSGGEGAITWYVASDVGVSEISGNYITGCRYGIELAPSVPAAAALGSILVAHNTIDVVMQASKPSSINAPYCGRYGTSFWTAGVNKLNGTAITWRDNLFSRLLVYGMYLGGNSFLTSQLRFQNCMFWDCYWYYWPSTGRYTYESFEATGTARGTRLVPSRASSVQALSAGAQPNMGGRSSHGAKWRIPCSGHSSDDRALLSWENCCVADPRFAMVGSTASQFYSLLSGSPALKAATDGTNIGAWQ